MLFSQQKIFTVELKNRKALHEHTKLQIPQINETTQALQKIFLCKLNNEEPSTHEWPRVS